MHFKKILQSFLILVLAAALLPRAHASAEVTAVDLPAPLTVPEADDQLVAEYDYAYYPSGNVETISYNNGHGIEQLQSFTYDPSGRLATAEVETTQGSPTSQGDFSLRNYQYDSSGRLVNGDDKALYYDGASAKPYHAVDRTKRPFHELRL